MKFKVSEKVFEKYPEVVEVIVVARGLTNQTSKSKNILDKSKEVQKKLYEEFKEKDWMSESKYQLWIDRFKEIALDGGFLEEDDQYMPAHVSLTKRVVSGKGLPNINPIVNYYNMFSIENGIPAGGEDFSTVYGDMELGYADGSELCTTIGETKVDSVNKSEMIWKDDHSVTTRMWAWRQSVRTAITNNSSDIYFVFDFDLSLFENGIDDVEILIEKFNDGLEKYFDTKGEVAYLKKDSPEYEFDYPTKSISTGFDVKDDLGKIVAESAPKEKGSKGITKRRVESMGLIDSDNFDKKIEAIVNKAIEEKYEIIEGHFSLSQDPKMGDFSSTLPMRLSKVLKRNPRDIAENIVELLNQDESILKTFSIVEIAGPGFINFKISDSYLCEVLEDVLIDLGSFGSSSVGDNRVILVESPGWNPNKSPHVGHLLNLFLGKSLKRLFGKVGFEAIGDDIDNDKGLPVMQTIWAYQKYGEGKTPESEGVKPDLFVHGYYSVSKQMYEEDANVVSEVKEILLKWESGDPIIVGLWKQIVGWAYEGQKQVFETYGEVRDEYLWHESDVYKGGKDIVMKHIDNGVMEQLPDGAVIARIEQEYGLPDTIVVKSDGTGLYHTQDINLTLKKKDMFNPWKITWVVAEEQIAHFQRLFAILDALDIMPIENLYHFAYGFVVGKDGKKLSSRDGADLTADELYVKMHEGALNIISERSSDYTDEEKEKIARAVTIGAVKYGYLSRDPFKKIKFDMEEALSFSGKSGPYIMYAYTRGQNILKKIGDIDGFDGDIEMTIHDRDLLMKSLNYPKIIIDAANNFYPGLLAEYLYELAKTFNNFYENVSVTNSSDEEKAFRAELIQLSSHVLKDGLEVLGIDVLESM
jgi:arginyl-tRNA synthetase